MQDNQNTLVLQIDNQRQSVMGVNMDEEMIDIVKFQAGLQRHGPDDSPPPMRCWIK